jgi:hypothetical protein
MITDYAQNADLFATQIIGTILDIIFNRNLNEALEIVNA